MQYSVSEGEQGKVEVHVNIPAAGFGEAYKKALDSHVANANIAGFRPGKAPAEVVEKHVGVSKILNDTANFLVNKHLSEIFEKEKFFPIDSPKISIETLAQGSPFVFAVSFTKKPQVAVGDWKKLKVAKQAAKKVTQADIEESIKNIFDAWREQKASQVSQEETSDPGTSNQQGAKFIYDAQGNRIPISEDKSKRDRGDEPKIDDGFARSIGARDLSHLRELVKRDLETIVADQVEAKLEQELYEQILKISKVEVPDILIEDELNRILVRLSTELEKQGKALDAYLKEQNKTIDQLKEQWRPQAQKNVEITLIMDEIGRQEEVKVTREEIEQAMRGVTETNLSDEQRRDLERYLALSIFQAKTLDLVKKTIAA